MFRGTFVAALLISHVAHAAAGCPTVPPPRGSREAAFVNQTIARTPRYLAEFSIPGAAVAVIEDGRVNRAYPARRQNFLVAGFLTSPQKAGRFS
jgi:hypothetical protein